MSGGDLGLSRTLARAGPCCAARDSRSTSQTRLRPVMADQRTVEAEARRASLAKPPGQWYGARVTRPWSPKIQLRPTVSAAEAQRRPCAAQRVTHPPRFERPQGSCGGFASDATRARPRVASESRFNVSTRRPSCAGRGIESGSSVGLSTTCSRSKP